MLLWADNFCIYGVGGEAHATEGMYSEFGRGTGNSSYAMAADPAGSGASVVKFSLATDANRTLNPDYPGWDYELIANTTFTEVATDRDMNPPNGPRYNPYTVTYSFDGLVGATWQNVIQWSMNSDSESALGTWGVTIGGNFINYSPDHPGNVADVTIQVRHYLGGLSVFYHNDHVTGYGQYLNIPFSVTTDWEAARYVYYNTPDYDASMPRLKKTLDSSLTTVGASARLYLSTLGGSTLNGGLIGFADDTGATNIWLQTTSSGTIKAFRGAFAAAEPTLLGESTVCIGSADWYHIEAKVHFDNASGSVEVRVEGDVVLSLVGIDTVAGNANCKNILLAARFSDATAVDVYWKDFVIWDTTGTKNNTFIGPRPVLWQPVNADASLQWTPSTGSDGYAMMDEVGPNDADYTSATAAQTTPSRYGMEDIPAGYSTLVGIMVISRMAKSDADTGSVQIGVKVDASTDSDTADALTTSAKYYAHVHENSPVTGDDFTGDEFNSAELLTGRTA